MSITDTERLLPSYEQDGPSKTRELSNNRQNQKIGELPYKVNILAKALFCLTLPFSCCCGSVEVPSLTDVIVTRFGIPTDVLRVPNFYCLNPIGLETQAVSMNNWSSEITNVPVNDSYRMPLFITAQYTYKVVDSLAATYNTPDYQNLLHQQAKSALMQVASKYPFDTSKCDAITLNSHRPIIEKEMAEALQVLVKTVGIQIHYFRFISIRYDGKMQKLLLAKQQAEAYIQGRDVIAKSATGVVEKTIHSLQKQGIELDPQQIEALTVDLIYMICNQDKTDLNFYQTI